MIMSPRKPNQVVREQGKQRNDHGLPSGGLDAYHIQEGTRRVPFAVASWRPLSSPMSSTTASPRRRRGGGRGHGRTKGKCKALEGVCASGGVDMGGYLKTTRTDRGAPRMKNWKNTSFFFFAKTRFGPDRVHLARHVCSSDWFA